jgi:glyoxylase-like metal-dependent hydrolase (beta-lactamase superfamily II)
MNRFINCIVHNSSEGNLLIGDTHTALIDCGMMFCARETIQKVKDALGTRQLDYIFLSHTHYDHIGALPFFRKEWQSLRTVTTAIGAGILLKDTPRRVIRELSLVAAKMYGFTIDTDYNDDVFRGEIIVKDSDSISLGNLTVDVLETPGHTRDSLSFFIPELETLVLNETPGVLMPDSSVYPGYLTSYADAINSIEKCRKISHKYLSLPHRSIANNDDADSFFDKAYATTVSCRDFILDMKKKGLNEEEMQEMFVNKYYSDVLSDYQPKEAFMANARATISCTLREDGG